MLKLRIKQTSREDGKILLNVTVAAADVDRLIEAAAFVFAHQNKIDLSHLVQKAQKESGQAGGRVPVPPHDEVRAVVIKAVGEPQYNAFIDHYARNFWAPFAITQENLMTGVAPETFTESVLRPGKDFNFSVVVTPKPQYKLTSYDPVRISLPKTAKSVTTEEIETRVQALADQNAGFVPDTTKAAAVTPGGEINIKIQVDDEDGVPIPHLTADKRQYTLGTGFLPAEFDRNIMGAKPGEVKEFDFKMPGPIMPDGSEGEIKLVHATVTILEVLKKVLPKLTDAWVNQTFPGISSLKQLRDELRQQGEEYKNNELENMKMFMSANALAERLDAKIPDEVYEEMRNSIMANLTTELEQQGKTVEEHLAENNIDEQNFSMQIMLQARETLRQGYALDELARHLKLKVETKDLEEVYTRMAPLDKVQQVKSEFENTGRLYVVREAALRTKANKWLVDHAEISWVDAPAPAM